MEFESLEAIVDFAIEKEIEAAEYSYNTSIKFFKFEKKSPITSIGSFYRNLFNNSTY